MSQNTFLLSNTLLSLSLTHSFRLTDIDLTVPGSKVVQNSTQHSYELSSTDKNLGQQCASFKTISLGDTLWETVSAWSYWLFFFKSSSPGRLIPRGPSWPLWAGPVYRALLAFLATGYELWTGAGRQTPTQLFSSGFLRRDKGEGGKMRGNAHVSALSLEGGLQMENCPQQEGSQGDMYFQNEGVYIRPYALHCLTHSTPF